jgi:hypothetical protein
MSTTRHTTDAQRIANSIARQHGSGKATTIIRDRRFKPGSGIVAKQEDYCWRKNTTGERVPNSYRSNFGWKNTHYSPAHCTVRCNWED